ncbi:MAG: hypothetical protein BGN88_12425 [Clostridiales bacterium 43-6]|nr:MAG: hypothetical protein BGN88_12425 [Clostridiales bacterium 43-6]
MKQKLTIALVAILTFTLIQSGCVVAPQPAEAAAEELRPYADNVIRENDESYGYGARGRGAKISGDSVTEVGNGVYGNGNGAGTGYTDSCDPIYDGTATADPDYTLTEADQALSLAGYGAAGALGDPSLSLADMLTYAMQDESIARAEYAAILATYGSVRPFTNIIRAEESHILALQPLFEAYGIAVPADESASLVTTVPSLTEAYQTGVSAEVNNIAMYETFLDQNLPDNVRVVFESLMRASENHLRAFQNRL